MIRIKNEPLSGGEPVVTIIDDIDERDPTIPRVSQVWTYTGKRMDIVKRIVRVKNTKSKKRIYAVEWESNMLPTRVRDLLKNWKYVGFFFKMK